MTVRMSLPFEKYSELIVLALFSYPFHKDKDELAELVAEQLKTSKKKTFEAIEVAESILAQHESIDEQITLHLREYTLERLGKVELAVLRYCVYVLNGKEHEEGRVISEGIRLCRKFASDQAGDLIHAVLDAIVKSKKT